MADDSDLPGLLVSLDSPSNRPAVEVSLKFVKYKLLARFSLQQFHWCHSAQREVWHLQVRPDLIRVAKQADRKRCHITF